jgi:hypothetical protein
MGGGQLVFEELLAVEEVRERLDVVDELLVAGAVDRPRVLGQAARRLSPPPLPAAA